MSNKSSSQSTSGLPEIGGTVFGRYKIEKEMISNQLSQTVFKAQDTIFDINVVLRYLSDIKHYDIFTKTGQSMTKLSVHPNIASVFECKSVPDCIVREFIEGGNAKTYFENTQCITLAEKMEKVLVMSVEISAALSYLQEQSICCSNIMLSSILLTNDGVFKLADVGLWGQGKQIPTPEDVLKDFCEVLQQAFRCIEKSHVGESRKYLEDINSLINTNSLEELKHKSEYLLQEIEQAKKAKLDNLINRAFKPVERETNFSKFMKICEEVKNDKIETKLGDLLKKIEKEEKEAEENSPLDPIKNMVRDIYEDVKNEKPKLDNLLKTIEKEEKETEENSPLDPIKNIVRKNIEESVQRIVESLYNYPGLTILNKEKFWYPTILMRSSEGQQSNRVMGKYFVPVFYGQYKESNCIASGSWQKGSVNAVLIDNSCAGLPIVWNLAKIAEADKKWLYCPSDANDFVEYCTLVDLQAARKKSEYIKKIYRTPADLSILMQSKAGKCPEMGEIANRIETEIVVPIYGSLQKDYRGKANNIIGVVNFEFEQKLEESEAKLIGKTLNSIVKSESFLPTEIVCDLLSITFSAKNDIVEASRDPKMNEKTNPEFNESREMAFHSSTNSFKEASSIV
jgi:Protein tyrosine and serine/threonine kinase